MYVGLTISVMLHLSLLGWALVSFAGTPALKIPEVQPVEVAIITDADLVRLKQGDRSSKNLQTRKAPEPEKSEPKKQPAKKPPPRRVVTAPPPPAAEPPPADPIAQKLANLTPPEPAPPPKPAPDPDALVLRQKLEAEKKAAEAKKQAEAAAKKKAEEARKRADAEAKRKAEARRKAAEKRRNEAQRKKRLAEQRRREEEKKKQFDANRISALLNKLPDSARPPAGSQDGPDDRKLPQGPAAGAPEGRDTQLTASQRSMIGVMMKGQTSRCWNINSGLAGADKLVVEVVVRMKPDGSLDGAPRVENMRSDPAFQDAANSALRALKLCAPYDLPADFYKGGWDHMVVTFDPQGMF